MDLLDRMLGHDRWTTAQYLEMSRNLTDEQLDQEFDIGLRTLRTTFDHMIFNVAAWTGSMVGKSIEMDRSDRSIDALLDRHERSYENFAKVARQMCEEQRLDDMFTDQFDYPKSNGGAILHVILHNALHRSEVLHIFHRLGVPNLPEGDPLEWERMTGITAASESRY